MSHIKDSTSHLNLVADKPVMTRSTPHLHINSAITNSMSHLNLVADVTLLSQTQHIIYMSTHELYETSA